jgi:hypothetical protein
VNEREIDDILRAAAPAPQDLDPALVKRLADSIEKPLRPVRPLPPGWLLTLGVVLVSAAVALAGAARAGFFGFIKMDLFERVLMFFALAVLLWIAGSEYVRAMIPGSRRRFSSAALLTTITVILAGVLAILFRDYQVTQFFSIGIACLVTGFLHAIPAGLLAWLLLRRGFAVSTISAGLAAGALGGLAGVSMLELHCPNFQAAHVLVWHLAVVPLSAGAGALIGWALREWHAAQARRRG